MASGGYRPGAGRPKGAQDKKPRKGSEKPSKAQKKGIETPLNQSDREKIKEILSIDLDTRDKAKRYSELLTRASKGELLTAAEKQSMAELRKYLEKRLAEKEGKGVVCESPDAKAFLENLLMAPEEEVDRKTKIQIANILLPYQHPRKGEGVGKKEDKADRAKAASSGKFAPGKQPLKVVK